MAKSTNTSKVQKKRIVHVEPYADVYITASFNNVIVTFTNKSGQVICWKTSGSIGFKGSKKSTPYAAQVAAMEATKIAVLAGVKKCDIYVKGPGSGRESAIRSIVTNGVEVMVIKDITSLPHNGCRPPKKRRI